MRDQQRLRLPLLDGRKALLPDFEIDVGGAWAATQNRSAPRNARHVAHECDPESALK
jgi:hypothetical protein